MILDLSVCRKPIRDLGNEIREFVEDQGYKCNVTVKTLMGESSVKDCYLVCTYFKSDDDRLMYTAELYPVDCDKKKTFGYIRSIINQIKTGKIREV